MLYEADKAEILPESVSALIVEIYLEEAENENAAAMTNLGSLYYTGRGGEQNYEKAVKYYAMADIIAVIVYFCAGSGAFSERKEFPYGHLRFRTLACILRQHPCHTELSPQDHV